MLERKFQSSSSIKDDFNHCFSAQNYKNVECFCDHITSFLACQKLKHSNVFNVFEISRFYSPRLHLFN